MIECDFICPSDILEVSNKTSAVTVLVYTWGKVPSESVVARASIMPAHPLRSFKSSFTNKSKSSFYILKQFKIASFRSSLGSQSGRHPQGMAHARSLNSESFFNLIPTVVSLVSKKRELLERAWSIHWSINVAPRWIKQDRDQFKKIEDKICYLSQLKHLDMNAIALGKHVRRTSFLKPKPLNVTNNDFVIFIFFWLFFLVAIRHTM